MKHLLSKEQELSLSEWLQKIRSNVESITEYQEVALDAPKKDYEAIANCIDSCLINILEATSSIERIAIDLNGGEVLEYEQ